MISTAELDAMSAGVTVPKMFLDRVAKSANEPALRWKHDDEYREWTWSEYAEQVAIYVSVFKSLGLTRGDRVVLMMRNIAAFHPLDIAANFCGAASISIYNSSSPEQIAYLAGHCEAKIAVVEGEPFLSKFAEVRDSLPQLKTVVSLAGSSDHALSMPDLIAAAHPVNLEDEVGAAQADDIATMIYTSGTTGNPKGVIIDHSNVVWTSNCLMSMMPDPAGMRQISYLPMAHIAERMTGHYNHINGGLVSTSCPEPSQIPAYLREVRPQLFFAVPRIWEKLEAGVRSFIASQPEENRGGIEEAMRVGRLFAEASASSESISDELNQAHAAAKVVLDMGASMLGLEEIEVAITGAAPIAADTLWFFRSLGVKLSEIYGMSESTGPITWDPFEVRVGSVGRAVPGVTVVIADDGEVLFKGGNVFKGYLKEPGKTAEAIDEDGWVHTGDIGTLDADGYLSIVDRKKELIITAGGKNISPANIESALKGSPLVGQACVIGDKRPYLTALIVLDSEVAPVWAKSEGIQDTSLQALATNPKVSSAIHAWVEHVNEGFSRTEGVKKVKILSEEWMPDSDQLTPTMKLKRRGIAERYAQDIEALYSS